MAIFPGLEHHLPCPCVHIQPVFIKNSFLFQPQKQWDAAVVTWRINPTLEGNAPRCPRDTPISVCAGPQSPLLPNSAPTDLNSSLANNILPIYPSPGQVGLSPLSRDPVYSLFTIWPVLLEVRPMGGTSMAHRLPRSL